MPDTHALRLAELMNDINNLTGVRGRCIECGEPNRDGCGCWLQDMFNQVPMSIIHLMAEIDAKPEGGQR